MTTSGDPQAAVAFAFGWREASDARLPGTSNEQLAMIAARAAEEIPLVAEDDVASALPPETPLLARLCAEPRERYLGTAGIAHRAACVLLPLDLRRVMVIAHPAHRSRAEDSCTLHGLEVVSAPELHVDFDSDSAQWWTRDPIRWWARELPLRTLRRGAELLDTRIARRI